MLIKRLFAAVYFLSLCPYSFAMESNVYPYIRYEVPKSEECSEPFFAEAKFNSKDFNTRAVNTERFANHPPIVQYQDLRKSIDEMSDKVFSEAQIEDIRFRRWLLNNLRNAALLYIKSWEDYEKRRQFFYEEFCNASPISTLVIVPEPLSGIVLGTKFISKPEVGSKENLAGQFTIKSKSSSYFQSNATVYTDENGVIYSVIRQMKPVTSRKESDLLREAIIKSLDEKYSYFETREIRDGLGDYAFQFSSSSPNNTRHIRRVSSDNKFQIELYSNTSLLSSLALSTSNKPVTHTLIYTYRPIDAKRRRSLSPSFTEPMKKRSTVDTIRDKIKGDI